MLELKKSILKIYYKMESNELTETDIKNCTCYHFDDLIKIGDFDYDKILIDEKSYKNILANGISCKTLFG